MEKRKPHYNLQDIQKQMNVVDTLRLTASARKGLVSMGFSDKNVVAIIKKLTIADFKKSMTTYIDNAVWQDVYNTTYNNIDLYIKFQMDNDGYFVISFKEL